MHALGTWTLALVVAAAWGAPARAGEGDKAKEKVVPEEGAIQVILLRQKSVREDLKLTDDEAKKVHAFAARQWEKAREIERLSPEKRPSRFAALTRENEAFLAETLEPGQRKRLKQIALQLSGLLWVTRPEIVAELELTDEQKNRAYQLQQQARQETEEIVQAQSREFRKEEFQELRKRCYKRLSGLFTAEQRAKWMEMIGEPFGGEIRFDDAKR